MRLFLVIKREAGTKDDFYISGVIKSDSYPSTYAAEHPEVKIKELPEIKDEGFTSCHICL